MIERNPDGRVGMVRRFNRFYTQRIGVLQEGWLKSPFSLSELRVLYELSHRDRPAAVEVSRELGLDEGYLSRILRSFEKDGLISRAPSEADGRQSLLALTEKGRKTFAPLDQRTHDEVAAMLGGLSIADQDRLIAAMEAIERLLRPETEKRVPYILRPHHPGDMGWVVQRHGILYAREYGWNEQFEALVAEIVAAFIKGFDPKRERCWIAEREGENVGCIFLVKKTVRTAKLRLLLVEPSARGLGIGRRLVDECVRFAQQAGYRKVTLWTNSLLHAARHIYVGAGFRLVHEEPHHSFGHDLVGQNWELEV
jgi:DNA-binding MarR family transcriptional regulator/N-acetylglutamate synthase-like GNAT family acetyltransferase